MSWLCIWRGHKWPRVSWDTHKVGDLVKCQRRGCRARTAVRCEDCGGPVTLPAYRSTWHPPVGQSGPPFFQMLHHTPCSPMARALFDPIANARAAVERYAGKRSWDRYVKGNYGRGD